MSLDAVAARYAQALCESAKSEGRLAEVLEELLLLKRLIEEHPLLSELFLNPDVDPDDKLGVLERVLQGSWSPLVRAFVQVIIGFGRAEYLAGIVEAFQQAVDREQHRLRVTVRSARPVPEPLLNRLTKSLAQRERATIEMRAEIDPTLLGGVQVLLDHRVIDGSVRRQLDDLTHQLKQVPVR